MCIWNLSEINIDDEGDDVVVDGDINVNIIEIDGNIFRLYRGGWESCVCFYWRISVYIGAE